MAQTKKLSVKLNLKIWTFTMNLAHNAKVQPRRRRRRRVEGRSPGTNWNFLLCALATPVLIQGTEPEATPLAIYSGLTALHC